jgi:hypothetical protein
MKSIESNNGLASWLGWLAWVPVFAAGGIFVICLYAMRIGLPLTELTSSTTLGVAALLTTTLFYFMFWWTIGGTGLSLRWVIGAPIAWFERRRFKAPKLLNILFRLGPADKLISLYWFAPTLLLLVTLVFWHSHTGWVVTAWIGSLVVGVMIGLMAWVVARRPQRVHDSRLSAEENIQAHRQHPKDTIILMLLIAFLPVGLLAPFGAKPLDAIAQSLQLRVVGTAVAVDAKEMAHLLSQLQTEEKINFRALPSACVDWCLVSPVTVAWRGGKDGSTVLEFETPNQRIVRPFLPASAVRVYVSRRAEN